MSAQCKAGRAISYSNRCVRTWIACEIVRLDVRSCQVVQVVGLHHGGICLPVACCASETQKKAAMAVGTERDVLGADHRRSLVSVSLCLASEGERTGFRVPRGVRHDSPWDSSNSHRNEGKKPQKHPSSFSQKTPRLRAAGEGVTVPGTSVPDRTS